MSISASRCISLINFLGENKIQKLEIEKDINIYKLL